MKLFTSKKKKHAPIRPKDTLSNENLSNNNKYRSSEELKAEYIRESFSKFQAIPSKYKLLNKPRKKRILWPFIVVFPILFINILLNMIENDSTSAQEANTSKSSTLDDETYNFSSHAKEIEYIFNNVPHTPPEDIQHYILNNLVVFTKDLLQVLNATESDLLLLVDKQHSLPENYVPADLVTLDAFSPPLSLSKKSMELRNILLDDLLVMDKAARQVQIFLVISSCYRSYSYQNTIFNSITKSIGLEEAQRQSARPGTSQHQLGTTLDFGSIDESFAYTEAGQWLKHKAWQYGFSLSYPENYESLTGYIYESWHYRYIGKLATLFEQSYFKGIQQYMLEFINYIPENSILRTPL